LLAAACLMQLMVLLSPVCHLHYFVVQVPLLLALLARWPAAGYGRLALPAVLAVNAVLQTMPHLPQADLLRDTGAAAGGTLLLWGAGVVVLFRRGRAAGAGETALLAAAVRAA
jgi:hypothetical protein